MKIKTEALQVVVVASHEEAPESPMQGGRIDKLGLSHLVATCPGLSTAAGQFGLLWPREGGSEPPGEEMGVRGSWVEFLMRPQSAMGAEERWEVGRK